MEQGKVPRGLISLLTLIIISILICIVVSELLLRILHQPRFYKRHTFPPQFAFLNTYTNEVIYFNIPSEHIRFVYDGNPRGYFGTDNEIDHITNSFGFRGGEFSLEKPGNTFRIAFLGDSFTFGEGVYFADTYSELTSLNFKQKYQTSSIKFESYNFGVGGYNILNVITLFKNIVLKFSPDVVVVKYDICDIEPVLFEKDKNTGAIKRCPRWYEENPKDTFYSDYPPDKFIYRSRIVQLCWQVLRIFKENRKMLTYYKSLYNNGNSAWEEARRSLTEIILLCRSKDIPCYILCFPLLHQLNDHYPFKEEQELFGRVVENEGGIFIDLFPRLKNLDARELWVHPTDHHPNELVHRMAADILAEKMFQDKNIVKKLSIIQKN